MTHPLDISHILKAKGVSLEKPKQKRPPADNKKYQPQIKHQASEAKLDASPRIKQQYWIQLHTECRKLLTSRVWKGVDFNPMFEHLDDLTKITAKWLKWAIPTYVNGKDAGPIKDWLDGTKREKDFHYVLVGEHLRFIKERRDERKSEQKQNVISDAWIKVSDELSAHIDWFVDFVAGQSAKVQGIT